MPIFWMVWTADGGITNHKVDMPRYVMIYDMFIYRYIYMHELHDKIFITFTYIYVYDYIPMCFLKLIEVDDRTDSRFFIL